MGCFEDPLAVVSPAVYGLVGSLIGGFIAGTVSVLVAWQSRSAAERAWVRDSRREIYDRFLTNAQRLLIVLEGEGDDDEVKTAYAEFFEPYVVVQTVAERPVVDAARTYAYRLLELKAESDARKPSGEEYFRDVAEHVRFARHDTIDAMRTELGLAGSARPPRPPNPFMGTDLELRYEAAAEARKQGRTPQVG